MKPLLPGKKYLTAPPVGAPTAFEAEPWLPAWVRVARHADKAFPLPARPVEAQRLLSLLAGDARFGDDKTSHRVGAWLDTSTSTFRQWLKHSRSLRAPKPPEWWWRAQGERPLLDTFELANLRLPGTLRDNISVLALQLWTQGFRLYEDLPEFLKHRFGGLRQLDEGMALLQADPWFRWVVSHRRLKQGIIFKGAAVTASYRRIQYLTVSNPLDVTEGELAQILASPLWTVAEELEREARSKDRRPALLKGPWYYPVQVVRTGWTSGRYHDATFKE